MSELGEKQEMKAKMKHRRQRRPQLWLEMKIQAKLSIYDTVAVRCLKPESDGYSSRISINHLQMESDKHLKFHRGLIILARYNSAWLSLKHIKQKQKNCAK